MEGWPNTTSFLRNREAGDRNVDDTSTSIQHLNIPERPQLFLGVCTRPLAELSRTTVAQLRLDERAKGFYLLLRTLAPTVTVRVKSVFGENALVQVEDNFKNRTLCCLYGHVHLRSEQELKEMLPVNTVLALKEPLLIVYSEQQFAVVVGSPTDFVIVGRSHVLYKDAEALGWTEKTEDEGMELTWKWMRIGVDLFQKRKFDDAADAFLFALNNCWDSSTRLKLNQLLSTSFLAQESYESALKHALIVLETEPLNERALYSAGRASYELRNYTKARLYFVTLKRIFPSNENYLAELSRCEERLGEAEGNVEIFKLYRACLTDVTAPIDHANFWRNIEFRPGPDNIRGVFATQDMEPGTLIVVEKAVVTIFEPSCSTELGTVSFMRTAFRAALKNPKTLGQKLRYLPGGCSITDEDLNTFCDEVNESEPIVDVCRLYGILYRNMLKFKNSLVEKAPYTYHVYEVASRFRHSCLSNCSFLAYKDVVVVRTSSSVSKGEELFLHYYGNHFSFPDKQKALNSRGLTCTCSLCALDKMEPTELHDLRQELKTKFDAEMALVARYNLHAAERLLPIVRELELTYRNRSSLRLLLFVVYRDLAKAVDRRKKDWKDKVALYVETGLQSVGLSTSFLLSCAEQVNPDIAHMALMPVVLYDFAALMAEKEYCSGRLDLVHKWIKVIFLLERIYRGGNMEMLKRSFLGFKIIPSFLPEIAKHVLLPESTGQ